MSSRGNTWDLLGRDFCIHGVQHVKHIQINDEKLWQQYHVLPYKEACNCSLKEYMLSV